MEERVNPIRLTIKKTGEVYELDFNREAVYLMDKAGFKIEEVTDYLASNVPQLFYFSFRKNHRKMTKAQTDRILRDVLHGVSGKMLERLVLLYQQAAMADNVQDEEDLAKNSEVEVEM